MSQWRIHTSMHGVIYNRKKVLKINKSYGLDEFLLKKKKFLKFLFNYLTQSCTIVHSSK